MVHEWIGRLTREDYFQEELSLRLSYASYLNLMLQINYLHFPFNECPPQGTLPIINISDILVIYLSFV